MFSAAEENYLKAIYTLQLEHGSLVSTNVIAEKICTKASSVTDMLKKLAAKIWANADPFVNSGVYIDVVVKPFRKTLPT